MVAEVKSSYALVQMSWISASQECMQTNAKETDNVVAKLFYQYVGLTLTGMEGVDKAACFAAEAVYDTPGTGSMMAWGMRALEIVALTTVFSLSLSFALSIITTAIVFTIVFGVIGGVLTSGGGSIGFFLEGMKDMLLSGPEEAAEVVSEVKNQGSPDMIMGIDLAPAGANDSGSGQQDGERERTPATTESDNPWHNHQMYAGKREKRPVAPPVESNPFEDLVNIKAADLLRTATLYSTSPAELVFTDPWRN